MLREKDSPNARADIGEGIANASNDKVLKCRRLSHKGRLVLALEEIPLLNETVRKL